MAAFKWNNNIKRASALDRLQCLEGFEMKEPLRSLMEKLLAKQSSVLPWYESLKCCDSLSNEQQLGSAKLTSLVDKHILILQKAITYQSACLVLDRLESIAKQFSLKFTASSSGTEALIHSEMFFWRFLLDSSGSVAVAEVSNDGVVENCPELCDKLRCGQFEELHEHISGLLAIYSLGTDKKQKKKAFKALQLMESELNILSNLQSSITNVSSYIHKSPLGILVPRCGGLPMRMIYFVSPYDLLHYKTKSSIPMTIEAIIDNKVGLSASVLIQNSNNTHDMPSSSDVVASVGVSSSSSCVSSSADFRFVLRLHHPIVMSLSVIRKIEKVTGLNVIDDSALRPITALLLEEKTRHRKMKDRNCSWEWHAVIMLSGHQHHQYFVTGRQDSTDLFGALVSEIPFMHPTMCPAVIVLLRQQALFNAILSSCIRRRCHYGNDLNNVMTFEVTPVSLQHLTVTWEHRSLDMLATVELDLTDLMAVECKMCPEFILENGESCSVLATKVLQRSLSLPITLRIILANTSSAGKSVKIASCFTWENLKTEEESSEDNSTLKSDVTTEQSNFVPQHVIPDGNPIVRKRRGSEQDSVERCSIMEKLLSSDNDLETSDMSLSFFGSGHTEAARKPIVALDDLKLLDKVTLNPVLASLLEQELPKNIPVSSATPQSVLSGLLSDKTIQPPSFAQVKPRRTKKRSGVADQSPVVRKCIKWRIGESSSTRLSPISSSSSQSSSLTTPVTPIAKSPLKAAVVLTSPVKTVDSFTLNVPSLSSPGFRSNAVVSSADAASLVFTSLSSTATVVAAASASSALSGPVISLSASSSSSVVAAAAATASVLDFHCDPVAFAVDDANPQPSLIDQPAAVTSVSSPGLDSKPDAEPVRDCSRSGHTSQKPDDSETPTEVLDIQMSDDGSKTHAEAEHLLPNTEASKSCRAAPVKDVILSALLSERESDDSISIGCQDDEDMDESALPENLAVFKRTDHSAVSDIKGCLSTPNKELSAEKKSVKANQLIAVEEKQVFQVKTESAAGEAFTKNCSVVLSTPAEVRMEDMMRSSETSCNNIKERWKEKTNKFTPGKSQLMVKLTKGKILKEILEQEREFESSLSVKESLAESQLNCRQNNNSSVDRDDQESNLNAEVGLPPVSSEVITTSVNPPATMESLTSGSSSVELFAKGKRRSDKRAKNLKGPASGSCHLQPAMKRPKKDDVKKSEMSKKQKIYDFDDENEIVNGDESAAKAECHVFPTMIKITKSAGGTLRIQETPKVNSASGEISSKNVVCESVSAALLSNVGTSKVLKLPEKGNSNVKLSASQQHINSRVLSRSKSDSHSSFGGRGKSDSKLYKTAMIKLKPVCVPASVCLTTGTSRPRGTQSVIVASCKTTLSSGTALSKSKGLAKSGKGSLSAVIDKLTRQHSLPTGGVSTAVDSTFDRVSQQKDLYDAIRLEIIREGNKPSTPTKEINSPHKSNLALKRSEMIAKPAEGKMLTENGNRYSSFNNQNISGSLCKNSSPVVNSSLASSVSPGVSPLRPSSVVSSAATPAASSAGGCLATVRNALAQVTTAGDTGLRLSSQPLKDSKAVLDVLNPKKEINTSSSRILAESSSSSSSSGVDSPIDFTVTVIAADHDDNSKMSCEMLTPSSANTSSCGASTSLTSSLTGDGIVPSYGTLTVSPKSCELLVASNSKLKLDDSLMDRSGSRHFMDPLVRLNQTKSDVSCGSSSGEVALPLVVHSNHLEDDGSSSIVRIPHTSPPLPLIGPESCDADPVANRSDPDTEASDELCGSEVTTGACCTVVVDTYSPVPSPFVTTAPEVATTSSASTFPVSFPVKGDSSVIDISQDVEAGVLQTQHGSPTSPVVDLPVTHLEFDLPVASFSLPAAAESNSPHATLSVPSSSSSVPAHQHNSSLVLSGNSCSPVSLPSGEQQAVETEPLLNNSMTEEMPTSCSSSSSPASSSPVIPDSPADFSMPVLSRLSSSSSSPKQSCSTESVTFQPVIADLKLDLLQSSEEHPSDLTMPVPNLTAKNESLVSAEEICVELEMNEGSNSLGATKLRPETATRKMSSASQSSRTSPGSLAALSDIDDDLMNEALIL